MQRNDEDNIMYPSQTAHTSGMTSATRKKWSRRNLLAEDGVSGRRNESPPVWTRGRREETEVDDLCRATDQDSVSVQSDHLQAQVRPFIALNRHGKDRPAT